MRFARSESSMPDISSLTVKRLSFSAGCTCAGTGWGTIAVVITNTLSAFAVFLAVLHPHPI